MDRPTYEEAYNKFTWAKSHLHLANVADVREERVAQLRWALSEAQTATAKVAQLLRAELGTPEPKP